MSSSTRSAKKNPVTLLERVFLRLRRSLVRHVRITEEGYDLIFRCESPVDIARARTLFTKERGTVDWIKSHVREGQTFLDIGANVGIYSLLAAKHVGRSGRVLAFEPHVVNVHTLMQNVRNNGLQETIKVFSCALNDKPGCFEFNYYSDVSGSSNSQLNERKDGTETAFSPAISEMKLAIAFDDLIGAGTIAAPHHVKIDVDGNEMLILRGMTLLLRGASAPLSIQVEVNPRYKLELLAFMSECEFSVSDRHYTLDGKSQLAQGADPEAISYNAVFTRPIRR